MAEDKGMEPVDEGMAVVPDAPLADVPTIIPELEDVVSQLATDVSFARKTWKDGSEGATPITAAELNRLEKGVADLTSTVNALRDSVSRKLEPSTETFYPKSMSEIDVTYVGPVALNGCSDAPAEFYKWGYLISFVGTDVGFQIYVPDVTSGTLFFRSKFDSSSYRDWKKLIGSSIQ